MLRENVGTIITCIISYLIGSINFGVIICKFKHIDIKKIGSGNPGATNVSRYLGKKIGALVAVLDGLKPILATFVAMIFLAIKINEFRQTSMVISAFFALIGHCWPIYHKFKGGKAVSTFTGMLLIANVLICLMFIGIWFIILKISKKVSVSSLLSAIIVTILLWIPIFSGNITYIKNGLDFYQKAYDNNLYFNFYNTHYMAIKSSFCDSYFTICIIITLSCIILVIRHWSNIKKILRGEELNYNDSKKIAEVELEKITKENKK
ncbi:glycerol-3-phosphate 1-O-acyltransferase PlsY [Spiroplasma endosymbiont of Aspidapion aeneum]|uniref:glycerol-3-phosphate 1-O-acyltransferase PlsY n=1 Tax=Spiroplasma endosymbiont of Aspidapion aeneum TaxID=3066276 RepID=UPI00313BD7C2